MNRKFKFRIKNGLVLMGDEGRRFLGNLEVENGDWVVMIDQGEIVRKEAFIDLKDYELKEGVNLREITEVENLFLVDFDKGICRVYLRTLTPVAALVLRALEEVLSVEILDFDFFPLNRDFYDEVFYADMVYGVVSVKWLVKKPVRGKLIARKVKKMLKGRFEFG